MKIFDEILNREVEVQEEITPEKGKEIRLEDPEEFKNIIEKGEQ